MASYQLLERNTTPTEAEIRHALEGNLCRCTGYQHIVNAVQYARQENAVEDRIIPSCVAQTLAQYGASRRAHASWHVSGIGGPTRMHADLGKHPRKEDVHDP